MRNASSRKLSRTAATIAASFAVVFAVTLAAAAPVAAQQEPASDDVEVTRAVVATGVQDREPTGEATSFDAGVGTVFFYTVFEGDFGERHFEHVWYRDGEEVGRVQLRARGPRWRTWSSKTIPADWAGEWVAQVVDAVGNELASVEFTVGGT